MTVTPNLERKVYVNFLIKHPREFFWLFLGITRHLFHHLELRVIRLSRSITGILRPSRCARPGVKMTLDCLGQVAFKPFTGPIPNDANVKLATKHIRITGEIDYDSAFEDIEDTFAVNRFGWLLCALLRYPSAEFARRALSHILCWISRKGEEPSGPAWESYSVAERLCNWPFILLIIKKLLPIADADLGVISQSMDKHLAHLLRHLEYHGKFTNNHILNDARGLYVGGMVLKDEGAMKKARAIFRQWTDKIFYSDGMMKDGSSHYQFLLTQRYEQVYHLSAHAGDSDFASFLQPWVHLMRQSCDFFLVPAGDNSWSIPMFGDISPDFTPRWFLPQEKGGWQEFKRWLNWEQVADRPGIQREWFESKGDFVRIDRGDAVIFWHIIKEARPLINHGHYDQASFVLFYKGRQIFADPGRFSYNQEHSFAQSAKAHNSIIVDSLGPLCEDGKLNLLNAYHGMTTAFRVWRTDESLNLQVTSKGFTRLPLPVDWSRTFGIYPDRMIITDELKTKATYMMESRFQTAFSLQLIEEDGKVDIFFASGGPITLKVADSWGYHRRLVFPKQEDAQEGWVSWEYGARQPAAVIVFDRELPSDKKFVYEIGWNNGES